MSPTQSTRLGLLFHLAKVDWEGEQRDTLTQSKGNTKKKHMKKDTAVR